MGIAILAAGSTSTSAQLFNKTPVLPQDMNVDFPKDVIEIGKGKSLSSDESMQIVVERAMDKLRSVVSDARSQLGLSEDQQVDTSPDATAGRIADFALGAFSSWSKNHTDVEGEDARQQFVDFIGGAIQQGISEARGILQSLNSLTGEVDGNIDKTWSAVQSRLNDFVSKGA